MHLAYTGSGICKKKLRIIIERFTKVKKFVNLKLFNFQVIYPKISLIVDRSA
jgi:hypothetical protein